MNRRAFADLSIQPTTCRRTRSKSDLRTVVVLRFGSTASNDSPMPTLLEKIEANAAARLSLPAGRPPSQELARYKNFLKVESHRLKLLHRSGAGGREISGARAAMMDVLLRYVLRAVTLAIQPSSKTPPPRLALV